MSPISNLSDYKAVVQNEVNLLLGEFKGRPRQGWKNKLQTLLHERVANGNEIVDNEENAIAVLRYSDHPTCGITRGTGPTHAQDFKDKYNGTDSFPFSGFAACAFEQDVLVGVLKAFERRKININDY